MTTALVKSFNVVKDATATIGKFDIEVSRAREIYISALKRAEAEYYERIKQAMQKISGAVAEDAEMPVSTASEPAAALN